MSTKKPFCSGHAAPPTATGRADPVERQDLGSLFLNLADQNAGRSAYRFVDRHGRVASSLTYDEVVSLGATLACHFVDRRLAGERILVALPTGPEYIVTMVACFLAGVVAVPAYPLGAKGLDRRQAVIIADCAPMALVTLSGHRDSAVQHVAHIENLTVIAVDLAELRCAVSGRLPGKAGLLAYLQYTSGSTGDPKGVCVTHQNVIANCKALTLAFGVRTDRPGISWLPLYHDMGLVGAVLHAFLGSFEMILMSPSDFMRRPFQWVELIDRHRVWGTPAPNFAFDLVAQRTDDEMVAGLDLGSWEVACCGAEVVRPSTIKRFLDRFRPAGVTPSLFRPCYGLAEATLLVASIGREDRVTTRKVWADHLGPGQTITPAASDTDANVELVSLGQPAAGSCIVIAEPGSSRPCRTGTVGEVCVQGPGVAAGYWGNTNAPAFKSRIDGHSGEFLRTGDLGAVVEGELLVVGRLKDLIICRGRNLHPNDLEAAASNSHDALSATGAAAFAADDSGTERIVLVVELRRALPSDFDTTPVFNAVLAALSETLAVRPAKIALVKANRLPKTSSGKIRRKEACKRFWSGELSPVAVWSDPTSDVSDRGVATSSIDVTAESAVPADDEDRQVADLTAWLRDYSARHVNSHLMDKRRTISPKVVLDFGNQGLLGLQVARSFGGLGLSHKASARLISQIAAIDTTLATFVGVNQALGTTPIQKFASPGVQAELLPQIATGRILAAFAITEAGAGSNPRSLQTVARPGSNGHLRLTGEKQWIGSGAWAAVTSVFARELDDDGAFAGFSGFLVRDGAAGLFQGPEHLTMGMRAMVQNKVILENVSVPSSDRLGKVGEGLDIAQEVMRVGRLGVCALSLGAARRAFQIAHHYSAGRTVAGGCLAALGSTRLRLGTMAARIEIIDGLLSTLTERLDNGLGVSEVMSSVAKIVAPEHSFAVVDDALQLLGGRGYDEPNGLAQFLRDTRLLRIFEGPTETLQAHLGLQLIASNLSIPELPGGAGVVSDVVDEARALCVGSDDGQRQAVAWCLGRVAAPLIAMELLRAGLSRRCLRFAEAEVERNRRRLAQLGNFACPSIADIENFSSAIADAIGKVDCAETGPTSKRDPMLELNPAAAPPTPPSEPDVDTRLPAHPASLHAEAPELQRHVLQWLAGKMQRDPATIDLKAPLARLGLDSFDLLEFSLELENVLGREIENELSLLLSAESIEEAIDLIIARDASSRAAEERATLENRAGRGEREGIGL